MPGQITKSPCVLQFGPRSSGDVITGELQTIRGGGRKAVCWSGSLLTAAAFGGIPGAVVSGGHVQIYSGAGRLNTVLPHQAMQSGLPVFFYDAAGITVSGVSVSGQAIVGVLPGVNQGYMIAGFQSGGGNPPWSWRYEIDMPFFSGLCAAVPSGTPGFTASFTPEVSTTSPGI